MVTKRYTFAIVFGNKVSSEMGKASAIAKAKTLAKKRKIWVGVDRITIFGSGNKTRTSSTVSHIINPKGQIILHKDVNGKISRMGKLGGEFKRF